MAEQRFERDLRTALAADLDPVHGPHPRWADAPVARQIAAGRGAPSRWRTAALLVAAAVGVVAIAVLAVAPREVPVATAPPATIEPWPSAVAPNATPTTGEIQLGQVAVATAYGEPALLIRVSDAGAARDGETGRDGIQLHLEVRVIGPLDREVGLDRFVVLRAGRPDPGDPDAIWVADPVGFPIAAGAPVGTQASAATAVFVDPNEAVDLGWLGSGSSVTFRYAVHRPPPVPSVEIEGRCPTLEDYALASLQPSATPAPPSFDPVEPGATPSSGLLRSGEAGVLPAPDGSPGALVRVSNIRFCARLPDYRPDSMGGPASLLLADVEIEVLERGALWGFISGKTVVVANYGGRSDLTDALAFGMPGRNQGSSLDPAPGFSYRGTMAWEVPDSDVRVTIDENGVHPVQFSWLARDGSAYVPWTPEPSSDPAATPTTGTVRPSDRAILAAKGGTMPVWLGRVDVVPRYPGLVPEAPPAAFMEIPLVFGPGSGTFTFRPEEWVVAGPGGDALPFVRLPDTREGNDGLPNFWTASGPVETHPELPELPLWLLAQVPASGPVTLEYRPDGGPALVTWVLRDG
jgi:hypothetical protein